MPDDVLINKSALIERCVARVQEEYAGDDRNLFNNPTKQDSILLNLQRACEASIDLAIHVVRIKRLGVPQESREAFELLEASGLLDADLASRMKQMVGFRNIAIHDYTKLNLEVVKGIITKRLNDFVAFTKTMLTLT